MSFQYDAFSNKHACNVRLRKIINPLLYVWTKSAKYLSARYKVSNKPLGIHLSSLAACVMCRHLSSLAACVISVTIIQWSFVISRYSLDNFVGANGYCDIITVNTYAFY